MWKALLCFALVQPFALAKDLETAPTSVSGDFKYSPVGSDPVEFSFQYGLAPEIDAHSFEAFKHINENLKILEQTLDDRFEVVLLREEGDLTEIPAEITQGVRNVSVLEIPKELVRRFQHFYKTVYHKPSWSTGILMGTTKTAFSASVYFSTLPVETAMSMSLAMFSITTFVSAYGITRDNILTYEAKPRPSGAGWKAMLKPRYFLRTLSYNVLMANLYNEATHHRNTMEQATINALATSPTGLFFDVQRQLMLVGKRHLTAAYSLLVSPVFWVLSALEQTGSIRAITEISGYQIRPTVIASLAIYTGLIVANAKAGPQVIRFLEKVSTKMETARLWSLGVLNRATFGICSKWLEGPPSNRRPDKDSSRLATD